MDAKSKRPQSNRAQIVSAVVGVLGFVIVIVQVNLIRSNAREISARQVYMSYSESALRNPDLVEPDMAAIRADRVLFVKYKSFVSHMLFAYDEILSVYDHEEWRTSFEQEIKYHMDYICTDMPLADDAAYFPKMRALLKDLRKTCPAKGN
jgi:hypothetical protein